jgi:fermentation-respiration switch protein FrsA (DUF1100 family)
MRLLSRTTKHWSEMIFIGKNFFVLMAFSLLMQSCNHLFYHPHQRIYHTPDELDVQYSDLMISSLDGVALNVWWLKAKESPVDDASVKIPTTVLQFHGNAENMSTHFTSVAWLTMAGVDVVTFDYRGYGRSEGVSPDRQGLLNDGRAVLRWIKSHPVLGRSRLIIVGQSLGSAVAVVSLAQSPDVKISGLVIDSGFSSYRTIARSKLAHFWLTWPLQVPLSYLITDELSPIDFIEKLTMPVLFTHSKYDPVVPYALGQHLFSASKSLQKSFWDLTGTGHTAAFSQPGSPYRPKLVDWINELN